MSLYVLQLPDKTLAEGTAADSYTSCWSGSFLFVDDYFKHHGFMYRNKRHYNFRETFWKKWDASLNCALRNGFNIVECNLAVKK
jgi:hypothetical protein